MKTIVLVLWGIIFIFVIFLFNTHYAEADSKKLVQDIEGKKKFLLLERSDGVYLSEMQSLFRKRQIKLTGFENKEISSCHFKGAICLTQSVGAHSQNLQLIDYKKFKEIIFTDATGLISGNVISDEPNIMFIGDRLMVDNRDYDSDPLTKAKRSVYVYKEGAFFFDTALDISYD